MIGLQGTSHYADKSIRGSLKGLRRTRGDAEVSSRSGVAPSIVADPHPLRSILPFSLTGSS